jgi:hypothetical protein
MWRTSGDYGMFSIDSQQFVLGHSVDSSPQMHLIEYLQAEGLVWSGVEITPGDQFICLLSWASNPEHFPDTIGCPWLLLQNAAFYSVYRRCCFFMAMWVKHGKLQNFAFDKMTSRPTLLRFSQRPCCRWFPWNMSSGSLVCREMTAMRGLVWECLGVSSGKKNMWCNPHLGMMHKFSILLLKNISCQ